MLEKLVIVRHGEYRDPDLTPDGRNQVGLLAPLLTRELDGLPIIVVSSTAPRAKQTTEILIPKIGNVVGVEDSELLWSGGNKLDAENREMAFRLIEEKGKRCGALVFSTHLEFIKYFPTVWGQKNGFDIQPDQNRDCATAKVIYVKTGEMIYINPHKK